MNNNYSFLEYRQLPYLNEELYQSNKGKGWSLSYVYHFTEIRDVFLAYREWNKQFNLNDFFRYCQKIDLPYVKTPWTKRRILEHINSLVNFGLLNRDYLIVKNVFENSIINSEILTEELKVFESIYFSYYRFKEIFSWLIFDIEKEWDSGKVEQLDKNEIFYNSKSIFCLAENNRFTDTFFYSLNSNIRWQINPVDKDFMRFWDVFIKWGKELGVLQKISLSTLELSNISKKVISMVYIKNPKDLQLDLIEFIKNNYKRHDIKVPELIIDLILTYRATPFQVHDFIIGEYKRHKERLSLERTSSAFIEQYDDFENLFIKYKDSYISNIILRY